MPRNKAGPELDKGTGNQNVSIHFRGLTASIEGAYYLSFV